MRLPWGKLGDIRRLFLADQSFAILGCLSPEERCIVAPIEHRECKTICLIEILDPQDAFPDFREQAAQRIEERRKQLLAAGVRFSTRRMDLLATEDELLTVLSQFIDDSQVSTVVLDLTAFPKRFFCLFLKRLLLANNVQNVIAAYSEPGTRRYSDTHLAQDTSPCDHLPGFAAPLPPRGSTLVISVGFESLNMRSLLDLFRDKKEATKLILPFPPNGTAIRRVWNTVRQLSLADERILGDNLEVVAGWDCERVYRKLELYNAVGDGLTLAPFGPKPHSLAMALFATKHDSGLYYSQPKSYNPDYSQGCGRIWAYVTKWDGISCFERPCRPL